MTAPNFVRASFFNSKPQEIDSFQEIFSGALRAKKSELPQNYSDRSTLVNEFGYETVYSVQNKACKVDKISVAKVVSVEVKGKRNDWVVFSCNSIDDAVSFTRYGDELPEFNSKNLIDLSLTSDVFNIENEKHFILKIDSVDYTLQFETPNHYQKILSLERNVFGFNVYLRMTKSEYADNEIRWEYDLRLESSRGAKSARFLTISKPVSEDGKIYTHFRYFNGFEIEPIEYLKYFEDLKKIIIQLPKKDINFFPKFPLLED